MSGGHWDYMSHKLSERAVYSEVWELMAEIEHTLDWGICCDTCEDCAKLHVIDGLIEYFDGGATSVKKAIKAIRTSDKLCRKCTLRELFYEGTCLNWKHSPSRLGWENGSDFISKSEVDEGWGK